MAARNVGGARPSPKAKRKRKAQNNTESEQVTFGKSTETGERFAFFFGKASPFSQWHQAQFEVGEVKYNCAEQYMMHQKAVLFKDKKMADEILKSESPKEQKALGRKVSNFDPTIWGGECMTIVKNGNLAKFSQNDQLRQALFETQGTTLVEASPRDTLWGIGLGASNPKARERTTWRGRNKLGTVLTEVREELMLSMESKKQVFEDGGREVDVEGLSPRDQKPVTVDQEITSKVAAATDQSGNS